MTGDVRPATADALFRSARGRLAAVGVPTPDLDASLLVEHAAGLTALERMTDPSRVVGAPAAAALETALQRRLGGEPVHRIIGAREFYGLVLALNEATLVPRPDTEAVVDLALPFVRETVARKGACEILDLGTGSGAIALALLAGQERATATGTDISGRALEAARANAARHGLSSRFAALRSDWFSDVSGTYDLIVSNPPYIRTADIAGLDAEVRDHDPRIALDGGAGGLDAYRVIAERSAAHMATGAAIALEIGHDQKSAVVGLFDEAGYRKIAERKDISGRDRALFFTK